MRGPSLADALATMPFDRLSPSTLINRLGTGASSGK
jgi:hypothetical protein